MKSNKTVSDFKSQVLKIYRYMNLLKIQEKRIELQKMEGKLNCDRCCGSGMIQMAPGNVAVCSECNGTGGQNCCDGAAPPELLRAM